MTENLLAKKPEDMFIDRIVERIRNNSDDLVPDDLLRVMVEKAIDRAFFQERTVCDSYGTVHIREPLFVELVRDRMKSKVDRLIQEWVENNQEKIGQVIIRMLTEQLPYAIGNAIFKMISQGTQELSFDIMHRVSNNHQ